MMTIRSQRSFGDSPTSVPGLTPPEKNRAKEALKCFSAAFVFLVLGLLSLVANSATLALGAVSSPAVVAGLHLLTLGWLSLSILGALQVFMGVALGTSSAFSSLQAWTRWGWIAGAVLFPTGLVMQWAAVIAAGIFLLGVGLVLLTVQLVPALWAAQRGYLTRGFVTVSLISIWIAWILGGFAGLARAGYVSSGLLLPGYFKAHILIAAFGWVGAMIAGVGSHLVPMFALSKPTSQLAVKLALPIWAAVPITGLLSAFIPTPWTLVAWSLAGVASLLWIVQFTIFVKHRLRKERDYGLLLTQMATVALAVAWGIFLVFEAKETFFVGMLIVGWLVCFTLGIYHRVIPFLVWFTRFASGAGRGRVPRVKDLLDARLSAVTLIAMTTGLTLWSIGLCVYSVGFILGGSLLLLFGALSTLAQLKYLKGEMAPSKIPNFIKNKEIIRDARS